MVEPTIVTDSPESLPDLARRYRVVAAHEYLSAGAFQEQRNLRIINLCDNFRYLGSAYYCSLLAEARRQRIIPSVQTILELHTTRAPDDEALGELIQRTLNKLTLPAPATTIGLDIFFGTCSVGELEELARRIFAILPAPLLRVEFCKNAIWKIAALKPLAVNKLDPTQLAEFYLALDRYQQKRWQKAKQHSPPRYELAILHDPDDPLPPSNPQALHHFIKAGHELDMAVELIQKKDFHRLLTYDALFIRATTNINHYTYRFARQASKEGMVVIDDPDSILHCTNKIFLAELLRSARILTPRTLILHRQTLLAAEAQLGYPLVVKIPDGSFSRGIYKVEDRPGLEKTAALLFKESDLILAQEFMYTEFDWRVGVLDGDPLFVARYYMSAKHWQIVDHQSDGGVRMGDCQSVAFSDVPPQVVKTALRATKLIGNGLYGVDLKQVGNKIYVIEVNDNPNLDAGMEDCVLKEELYRRIMSVFLSRLDEKYLPPSKKKNRGLRRPTF